MFIKRQVHRTKSFNIGHGGEVYAVQLVSKTLSKRLRIIFKLWPSNFFCLSKIWKLRVQIQNIWLFLKWQFSDVLRFWSCPTLALYNVNYETVNYKFWLYFENPLHWISFTSTILIAPTPVTLNNSLLTFFLVWLWLSYKVN